MTPYNYYKGLLPEPHEELTGETYKDEGVTYARVYIWQPNSTGWYQWRPQAKDGSVSCLRVHSQRSLIK